MNMTIKNQSTGIYKKKLSISFKKGLMWINSNLKTLWDPTKIKKKDICSRKKTWQET